MSSFLCFICHSTVNADTNEEMREKYKEVIGMNLCPDSHLCHICCHVMNRLWLFRSVCLKRSLEYPVLFSEKGTLNLQRNDLEIHAVCLEDCEHYRTRNINSKYYHFTHFDGTFDSNNKYNLPNEYVELEDERQDFDEINSKVNYNADSNMNDDLNDNFNDNFNYSHNETQDDEHGNEFVCAKIACSQVLQESQTNLSNNQDYSFEDLEQKHDREVYNDEHQSIGSHDETDYNDDDMRQEEFASTSYTDANNSKEDEEPIENLVEEKPETPLTKEVNIIETIKDLDAEEGVKKKKKKKDKAKKDKKRFEKFILSVEEQRGELEARRKDKKYIEAEFKCFNCALGFLFKDTYQAHMMRHEESNGEYLCPICSLRFATTAVLRAHRALHAERHSCLRCNATVKRRNKTDHARECFNLKVDTASCHLCGRVFKDSTALQQHLKRFHQAKNSARTHACNVCGERCNDAAAVRTHMIKHIQRKFHCAVCARVFSSPHTLRAHTARHVTAAAPAVCACGASFTSEKGLRAHHRRAKAHAEASFECPVCMRACASAASARAHASSHGATRALACPTCSARYTTRRQLTRHARTHAPADGGKRALCHLCGANFKGNSKLNRHLREVCEKDKLEEELSSYYAQAAQAE